MQRKVVQRFYSRARDPLLGRLMPIPREKSHNVFTETVRLNKAYLCMWEEKILQEFPTLSKHAVPFVPPVEGNDNLQITKFGQIYPGCDLSPDTSITEKCRITVRNVEWLERSKIKDLIVSPLAYDSEDGSVMVGEERENEVTLECLYYPKYEQNLQYLKDTLASMTGRIVDNSTSTYSTSASGDVAADVGDKQQQQLDRKKKKIEFPEAWKRVDMAFQKPSNSNGEAGNAE